MSSDSQNATVYAGDDLVLNISITDENGKSLSVVGAAFVWTLAATAGATPAVTVTSAGGGIVLTNALSGWIKVTVLHTATTGLSGAMWHQLVMTDVNGNVSTITTGTLTFKVRS